MKIQRTLFASSALVLAAMPVLRAQEPVPAANPPAATGAEATPAQQQPRRAPRPYAQVITSRAHTERGGITVHRVDDRYFVEVPDSLMTRDFLLVTRIAGVPAGSGGFQSAGSSLNERMIGWERANDRVFLKSISTEAGADDSLPITRSVAQNNYAAIYPVMPKAVKL